MPDLPAEVGRPAGPDGEEPTEDDLAVGAWVRAPPGKLVLGDTLELRNVPAAVVEYAVGGYPVLERWLGYRKNRRLSLEEAQWLSETSRRIAVLLDLGGGSTPTTGGWRGSGPPPRRGTRGSGARS